MYKGIPYANKIVKRRQQQRLQFIHKQNLQGIRPLTTNVLEAYEPLANGPINNKKKQMLQQDRFTQIQRQNRMLLQKINVIMSKKPNFKQQKISTKKLKEQQKQRMNKSLHSQFRKKKLQDIEIENAKLLKRLQAGKSDYNNQKMKQDWKRQKSVIKSIGNYPFIIRDHIYSKRRKSLSSQSFQTSVQHSQLSPIQLVRLQSINNNNFLVTLKYNGQKLQIIGDNKTTKQIKVIEIPKQQAIQFIQYQCNGKIDAVFTCLRYDHKQRILYLVGKGVDIDNIQSTNTNHNQIQNQESLNHQTNQQNHQNILQNHQTNQLNYQVNQLSSIGNQFLQQLDKNNQDNKKRQMSNINEVDTMKQEESLLLQIKKPQISQMNKIQQSNIPKELQINNQPIQDFQQQKKQQKKQANIQTKKEQNKQNKQENQVQKYQIEQFNELYQAQKEKQLKNNQVEQDNKDDLVDKIQPNNSQDNQQHVQ